MPTTTAAPLFTEAVVTVTGLAFDSTTHTGHAGLRWGVVVPRPRDDSESELRGVLDEADAELTRRGYVRTAVWSYTSWSGNHSALRAPVAPLPEGHKPVPGSIEWFDQFPGFWSASQVVEDWINAHPGQLYNPSTIARRAKVDSHLVYTVLRYLDEGGYIAADGNGCWRKYAARR